ncbi:MAG: NAD-binding protein, partial [Bacteroidota bacterium]
LVFMIVLGTVLLNATTARLVARLLGVTQDNSTGVLLIGAQGFAVTIGKYLKESGRNVFVVDSNKRNIAKARKAGLNGIVANIYTDDLAEQYELLEVGFMLALTGSNDVNEYTLNAYSSIFGEHGAYRLITGDELKKRQKIASQHIFSYTDDYIDISEANRESAEIHEKAVNDTTEFRSIFQVLTREKYSVPLFLRYPDSSLHVLPRDIEDISINIEGYKIVYLGLPLPVDREEAVAVPT